MSEQGKPPVLRVPPILRPTRRGLGATEWILIGVGVFLTVGVIAGMTSGPVPAPVAAPARVAATVKPAKQTPKPASKPAPEAKPEPVAPQPPPAPVVSEDEPDSPSADPALEGAITRLQKTFDSPHRARVRRMLANAQEQMAERGVHEDQTDLAEHICDCVPPNSGITDIAGTTAAYIVLRTAPGSPYK
jgi:type IV secretory pathway VirB10-like protein